MKLNSKACNYVDYAFLLVLSMYIFQSGLLKDFSRLIVKYESGALQFYKSAPQQFGKIASVSWVELYFQLHPALQIH